MPTKCKILVSSINYNGEEVRVGYTCIDDKKESSKTFMKKDINFPIEVGKIYILIEYFLESDCAYDIAEM